MLETLLVIYIMGYMIAFGMLFAIADEGIAPMYLKILHCLLFGLFSWILIGDFIIGELEEIKNELRKLNEYNGKYKN